MLLIPLIEEEHRSSGKKRISTTLDPELWSWVQQQQRLHGSIAGYLRYLIIRHREQQQTGEFKPAELPQQSDPPRRTKPQHAARSTQLRMELLQELKQRLQEREAERSKAF